MTELDDFYALIGQIQREFPSIFALINQPGILEVALQIVSAEIAGTPWSAAQIDAGLKATPFYQNTPQTARDWFIMNGTDPASARQTQEARAQEIFNWLHQQGFQITQDEATYIAGETLARGNDTAAWQRDLIGSPFYAELLKRGTVGQSAIGDQLQALAASYAVPISPLTLFDWQAQIMTGQVDMNTFESYLREQAKSLFPGLSNAIDRGITVQQYVQPYQEIATRELGINPADVDWTDPKWSTAIHQIDPKTGSPISMSLDQWTSLLRSDPRYGFDQTMRAQDQATQLGQALAQRLGRAA